MKILKVPYFAQVDPTSCGPAAFQMVYKYIRPSRLSKFSQRRLYDKLKAPDPALFREEGSDVVRYRVSVGDLVQSAKNRGLHAAWGRVSPDPATAVTQIRFFVEDESIPLIACQRYSDAESQAGHFRVIVGVDEREVAFHDPSAETGGRECRWPLAKFMDYWRPTGPNVTGGVALWVAEREIPSPLGPDLPNAWADFALARP
jgi:predicted double-glycine peptidase